MTEEPSSSIKLPSATASILWGTWIWRLLLTVTSGYGSWLMLADTSSWIDFVKHISYFTELSTVMMFLVSLGSVIRPFVTRGTYRHRLEGNYGWFRGVAASMTVLTGIVYATLLGADYPDLSGKIAHIGLSDSHGTGLVLRWTQSDSAALVRAADVGNDAGSLFLALLLERALFWTPDV